MEIDRTFTVRQQLHVVHERLLEMVAEVQRPGSLSLGADDKWLGRILDVEGDVDIRTTDLGTTGIDVESTEGRIRFKLSIRHEPVELDSTQITAHAAIRPTGLIGSVLLRAMRPIVSELGLDPEDEGDRMVGEVTRILEADEGDWRREWHEHQAPGRSPDGASPEAIAELDLGDV